MNSTFNSKLSTNPDVVIRVENLYKEYRLGTISHGTLYKDLQSWWARVRGKEDPNSILSTLQPVNPSVLNDSGNPHFLALKNVSFEVKRGEILGIIGRNGAGKSTLLKILSEVTSPTKGTVKLKGRAASLLEVGTGFHPELTGRENIYLNGAILGMTKKKINDTFDEIVDFAEVEKFIDTPVKRYSSGMYVRLAFAVAAHLDPEILIVDEVLAVGDAAFQKKCLGKIGDIAGEGRTVLFVSHNMDAINTLCSRVMVVQGGEVVFDGGAQEGINLYLRSTIRGALVVDLSDPGGPARSGQQRYARITSVSTMDERSNPTDIFEMGRPFAASLVVKVKERVNEPEIGFCISTVKGARLHHLLSTWEKGISFLHAGTYRSTVTIDKLMLYPGTYTLTVWFRRSSREVPDDFIESPLVFRVIKSGAAGRSLDFLNVSQSGGVYVKAEWDVEAVETLSNSEESGID